ncbi:MAG TPA: serine/threonine-protein kinase [Labilithrix sp.]|nr:serine/threonine-protein kinase [Labilithrix sp.]
MPDPRAEERVGRVLDEKWTLERLLGVGGMGAVYAARHRNGARAAVKVLSPSMGRLPHIRKRFLHEGYAANRVEHAGAVKVLDDDVIQDGTDQGTAYLVMELLDGESLGDRAKREPPLTERDLLLITDGVLAVLEAAHANGVVHRDLKPDNLFLAVDAERMGLQVKVLDFGLARLLEAQEQTIAGMALGTPTYMSPEQAAGHVAEIDGRTDIYALGSILFQLVSNRRIHDAAHTLGLVVRMATMPAPKLRTVTPDVSEPLARIVDRALEFKREDRYPTASAMRADVQAALSILPEGDGTLNVVAAAPSAPKIAVASAPASASAPAAPALAPTVEVSPAAAAAAAPSLAEAADRDEPSLPEPSRVDKGMARTEAPTPAPPRSGFRGVVALAILGFSALLAWNHRTSIEALLRDASSGPELSSGPTTASSADEPAAMPSVVIDASEPDNSSLADASVLVEIPFDASLDDLADAADPADLAEAADAAVDALDAGDGDDEDESDDDDVDASTDAVPDASSSTPAAPSVPTAPTARRATPHVTPKVTPHKKPPPRRPPHQRRKKRAR